LSRQKAEVIQNQEDGCIHTGGQGEGKRINYKRLKDRGGQAHNRSSDQADVAE
jgi:hypothetical protein